MISLRDFLKILYIIVVGLLVSMFIYPILHESGHLLATLAFGGSVGKVSIFPAAYTECDVLSISALGKAVIGLSGMIFPMLFSWVRFKNFYVWYPVFVLRGIIFLSFAISAVSIGLFYNGTIVENEDVVQVLRICSEHTVMTIASVIVMAVLSAVLILTDHPIKRFFDYLLN